MTNENQNFLFKLILSLVVIGIVGYIFVGFLVVRHDNVYMGHDNEYEYYKIYSFYNRDSTIAKFPKDQIYNGKVVNKRTYRRGIPGKGRHIIYEVKIQISNGEIFTFNEHALYYNVKEGNKIRVLKTYYPFERTYYELNGSWR